MVKSHIVQLEHETRLKRYGEGHPCIDFIEVHLFGCDDAEEAVRKAREAVGDGWKVRSVLVHG